MPDHALFLFECRDRNAKPLPSITTVVPMAVDSIAPPNTLWRCLAVLGVSMAHGLFLAALPSHGVPVPDDAVRGTIEVVEAPAVAHAEPLPDPPSAVTPAVEPVAEPLPEPAVAPAAEPPRQEAVADSPAPIPARDPEPSPPDPGPQAVIATKPLGASAEPAAQPEASPKIGLPTSPIANTTISEHSSASKQPKPPPRLLAARPGLPKSATPPASEVPTAAAAQAFGTQDDRLVRETLTSRIRSAVQAAVQCPAAARMMGQSGKAVIAFDYRNGLIVGGLQLTRSSGIPVLDSAALNAVRDAHYPQAPPEALNRVLHLLIQVDEACGG